MNRVKNELEMCRRDNEYKLRRYIKEYKMGTVDL